MFLIVRRKPKQKKLIRKVSVLLKGKKTQDSKSYKKKAKQINILFWYLGVGKVIVIQI